MKILVTGSAGFIGFHLVKRLCSDGHAVTGIDNLNDYYDVQLKYDRLKETGIAEAAVNSDTEAVSTVYPQYTFLRMNLEDSVRLNELFKLHNFDVVCHLAAQAGVRYSIENPQAYISSNMVGFFNVIEACRNHNVRHFVYASSSSVYGNSHKMPLEVNDRTDSPVSLYAATKKSNELMAYAYSHLYNMKTTGLRFFTVYGPWGRPDMAPVLFTKAIMGNKPIKVFNMGNLERDFTFVDDIIEGIARILYSFSFLKKEEFADERVNSDPTTPNYSIYNIGKGTPVKLLEFIRTIEEASGKVAIKEFYPMQPGDVLKTFADVSALKSDFGYCPSTTLETGIKKFIQWYTEYYK